ncbi:hypothetical protein BJX62DRAFT_238178 [Aspergillus germanicus]
MPGLLLVPYDDSMRLGQGYNSFLQESCADGTVTFDKKERTSNMPINKTEPRSQVVSYSSCFVEKLSDIAQLLNISAGKSIKRGEIEISGSALSADEARFSSGDINVVLSVKVVAETTAISDLASFDQSLSNFRHMDSDTFHDLYGDSFISGFVEGGELHGIIFVRAIDRNQKSTIESALESAMNSLNKKDFTLPTSPVADNVDLETMLSTAETTISVNWIGGGQIRHEHEHDNEWSLWELLRAADSFPARVSMKPTRTHAILTKYDGIATFLSWAQPRQIRIRQYDTVHLYARELLDMYMAYKGHTKLVEDALAAPETYRESEAVDAVDISIQGLVTARKMIRTEMLNIVNVIDQLVKDHERAKAIEAKSRVPPPELWATRLPVKVSNGLERAIPQMIENDLLHSSFKNVQASERPAAP